MLVVEDNPVKQTVAVKWPERLGFETEVAADGEVALVALERRRYAAVLMDCQMPRLDGYDATRALRQREREGERTPVIAMTANAMKGDRERWYGRLPTEAGAPGHAGRDACALGIRRSPALR